MPRVYEHSFNELHTEDQVSPTQVDLGRSEEESPDATGARVINPEPRNPDAGKADQFGTIERVPEQEEEQFEIASTGNEETETEEEVPAKRGGEFEERLNRERRLREEAETRSRTLEAQLGDLSLKVDLQQQERDVEAANSKDDAKLKALKQKKAKALEEGDTDAQVDLDDEITDVKAAKRQRESELNAAREKAKEKKVQTQPQVPANPKARAWIEAHPEYNTDPLFREAAKSFDQALYKAGFNANSDDYYVRISRFLAEKFPDKVRPEYLKGRKGTKAGPGGLGSTGVRGGNGQTVNRDNTGSKVTISQSEIQMLQSMGQDTSNPQVLKEYARNKRADARAAAARSQ